MKKMLSRVLLLILGLEIVGLYFLGQIIGGWGILGLIIGTIVLGIQLIGRNKPQMGMGMGMDPMAMQQMMMGGNFMGRLTMMTAGFFLMIPGVLTDLLGIALLIPPVRSYIQKRLMAVMMRRMGNQFSQFM